MIRKSVPVVVAALTAFGLFGMSAPAQAALPKAKAYSNCTALNKVYKHGVAKKGGKDKVRSGKPVKNFTVYTAAYNKNTKLDRDKDGVACEKK
jgi:Excalibur calcium-binding domain